jgi:hypothetical protein
MSQALVLSDSVDVRRLIKRCRSTSFDNDGKESQHEARDKLLYTAKTQTDEIVALEHWGSGISAP